MLDEKRIEETFGIDIDKQKSPDYEFDIDSNLLIAKIKIDRSKYANKLASYSEILKKHFANDRIFVLSKIKEHRGLKNIFVILFKNSRASVTEEMKNFSPSYLIQNERGFLLVNQEDSYIWLYELKEITTPQFIFRGYRYKIANEIHIA